MLSHVVIYNEVMVTCTTDNTVAVSRKNVHMANLSHSKVSGVSVFFLVMDVVAYCRNTPLHVL